MNEWSERDLRNIREWNESKHPRDGDGKFTSGNKLVSAVKKYSDTPERDLKDMPKKKMTPAEKIVEVNLNAEVQKQFDAATPKERQNIAYRYIMDNLRGKYPMAYGRMVAIEKIGADKMSHTLNESKIRVLPELAKLIEASEFEGVVEAKKADGQSHKLFANFAYYKVAFQIGNEFYLGRLNVGIRKDGSSTLYDLNPFNRQ